MTGWIKLHRKITDHWIFSNPNYYRAWTIMLFTVNYESKKVLISGQLVDCERGQSILSLDNWVEKFGVSKKSGSWTAQKVRTFFDLLEKDHMINKENIIKTTRITICNYDTYQGEQHDNNTTITSKQHDDNNQITTTKEVKEIKKNISVIFDQFRAEFPGTKRGLKTELDNFLKKNNPETVELLLPALKAEKQHRETLSRAGQFIPQWKNLSTWINQRCWEQEFPQITPDEKSQTTIQKPATILKAI